MITIVLFLVPPPESETHSLFNYAQSSIYSVHHLGELHSVTNEWVESPDPNNTLKLIELAQVIIICP